MVFINLLPVREIKRRIRAKRQITAFILGIVCFLVILGLLGFLQWSTYQQRQDTLAKLKQEKQRYAQKLKTIKELEASKAELEKRIGIINKLKAESSLTVHILDEVANLIPYKRMWLTNLEQSGSSLRLTGMALDNQTIAGFMESLKKSAYIKAVNLTSSSLKKFADRDLTSFSLSCTIGVPEKEKEEKPSATQK